MNLRIPLVLSVVVLAGCSPGDAPCEPVLVADAAVQPTFQCRDGRTCSTPRPDQADGGVYQICPGSGGCATLVMANGQSQVGYC